MKIVIPDDYQNLVDHLDCYDLIRQHEIIRYREPARDLDQLVERLSDADTYSPDEGFIDKLKSAFR